MALRMHCPACLLPIPLLLLTGNASVPVLADCQTLQKAISSASPHEAITIRLKPNSSCRIAPLEISNRKNLTLDGGNSILIFNGNKTGIHIGVGSENISLHDLSIDYDPLPFTQGIVTGVHAGEFSFSIMDHYPPVNGNNNRVFLYDGQSRKLKTGGSTLYFSALEIDRNGRAGTIPIPSSHTASIRPGDLIAFRPRGNPAIRLDGLSKNVRLSNVSILSSPGMGIMGRYLEGDNAVNVRIIPGPPPPGSRQGRLLSVNADGVNFAYSRKGPEIDNSEISRAGDDGINLHGLVLGIGSITRARSAIAIRPFGNDGTLERIVRPADEVRFLARGDFHILGSARVSDFSQISTPSLQATADMAPLFPRAVRDGAKSATFYAISFSGDIPAGTAYLDILSAATDGFAIRNNRISLNRGHGIVVGASNGLIAGNSIVDTTHNALIVGPNFDPWREGSWPDHVAIIGNSIVNPCTDGPEGRKASERAAIYIGNDRTGGTSSISVQGNRVEACHGQWIKADRVERLSLLDNIFVANAGPSSPTSCDRISKWAVATARDYVVYGNRCEDPQRHAPVTEGLRGKMFPCPCTAFHPGPLWRAVYWRSSAARPMISSNVAPFCMK
ncbi:hypothetical protein [Sphingobium sp. Sx8-8]|uniref:hypothetical protein n=1 Tax=Sphingobium sp. Sx8-8 TaxID=2933617 RepID=UPI001F5AF404|nr:hypothetical protein [Sphingobium sp. Sx8-8]